MRGKPDFPMVRISEKGVLSTIELCSGLSTCSTALFKLIGRTPEV